MIKDWKREAAEECNVHTIDSHRQRVGRLLNDGGPVRNGTALRSAPGSRLRLEKKSKSSDSRWPLRSASAVPP